MKDIEDEIPFETPEGWEFIRFQEIITIISGVSYSKNDVSDNGIRILRGGNIGDAKVSLLEDDVFVPQKYYDDEKQVRINDVVIIASTGSQTVIGKAGFIEKNYANTQIGAFLRIIRHKKKQNGTILLYFSSFPILYFNLPIHQFWKQIFIMTELCNKQTIDNYHLSELLLILQQSYYTICFQ